MRVRAAWPWPSSPKRTQLCFTTWSKPSWRAQSLPAPQNWPTTRTLSTNPAPSWPRRDARRPSSPELSTPTRTQLFAPVSYFVKFFFLHQFRVGRNDRLSVIFKLWLSGDQCQMCWCVSLILWVSSAEQASTVNATNIREGREVHCAWEQNETWSGRNPSLIICVAVQILLDPAEIFDLQHLYSQSSMITSK